MKFNNVKIFNKYTQIKILDQNAYQKLTDENANKLQKIYLGSYKDIIENPKNDYYKNDFIEFEYSYGDTTKFEYL